MSESLRPTTTGTRFHALDNLRAILMWLGIVLHALSLYAVQPMPNAWRDEQQTIVADILVSLIHAFRMPAFFILAGFFAAMLAHSRGAGGLMRHRLARLALPFAVFWPIVWVATSVAALLFLNRMILGTWSLELSVVANLPIPHEPNTIHMWFLWMLLWFCIVTSVLWRLPHAWFAPFATALAWLARRPWGSLLLALPLLLAGAGYSRGFVVVSGSFLPPWNEWMYNGVFFAFGLVLYGQQSAFFELFQRRWPLYAVAGLVGYALSNLITERHGPVLLGAYSYDCAVWLWSFAVIGLALRFLPAHNEVLAYLSDSAYWVYLVHFPLTIFVGLLLFQLPLPALLKIALNVGGTTLLCLGSYRQLVRHTWIGQLLNGKRHPRPARSGPPVTGTA